MASTEGEARQPPHLPAADASGSASRTLGEALATTVNVLRDAGLEEPAAEARRLVEAAAGLRALDLVLAPDRPLDAPTLQRIADLTLRRAAREPLSRILGHREFYGRSFALSSGTLDPRPDTESLVGLVLDIANDARTPGWPRTILDVGTGTGAILVTLLAEFPHARGSGIDIEADALATAHANALRHGVAERAAFAARDMRTGLPAGYDLIVSNPPYIRSSDLPALAPEVRLHDPTAALDGGSDGMEFYRVLALAVSGLAPAGWLVVEVGAGQSQAVAALLLQHAPGATIRTAMDLLGHTRAVAIQPRSGVAQE